MPDLDVLRVELEAFMEWDTEDKSIVTTISCLMFAQHMLEKAGHPSIPVSEEEQERPWQ